MSLTSQEYANLAEHTYDREGQLRREVGQEIKLEGVRYMVLEYVDKPSSGYQGTIFQRVDTGDIVVAHRGTEFGREAIRDGVQADGGMVLNRTNSQASDAIALTRRANEIAEKNYGHYQPQPEVTVTGHSLGGTLAQITAHYYDLRGETFNAYGAVSLNHRIPEGGNRMVNHVMAGDPVSAASDHYGQVRIYAQAGEIAALRGAGYLNTPLPIDAPFRSMVAGVAGNVATHSMHNFLNEDGDGNPDVSPLRDPSTRQRANDNAALIAKYRGDIESTRSVVTISGRGPLGNLRDLYDDIRGPIPAGEPARREQEAERNRQHGGIAPQLFDGAGMYGAAGRDASLPPATQDPMFARFRESLPPGTSDDKVAHLVQQTKEQAGITDAKGIAAIQTIGNDVFVNGTTPGLKARLDLAEPAPPMAQTQQQALAFEQQQAQSRSVDNPVHARTV